MPETLREILKDELQRRVPAPVKALAEAVRLRHPHAAVAVLFYGAGLHAPEAELEEHLLDYYLLVDDYRGAYEDYWLAVANRVLPPNVFHLEAEIDGRRLRAKYGVISLADFAHGCSGAVRNVSIWARFSQPARLVWVRDAARSESIADACCDAVRTMLGRTWPLEPEARDAGTLWARALRETYAAELRPEGADRVLRVVEAGRAYYDRLTPIVLAELKAPATSPAVARRAWRGRRRRGKLLNLVRLVKAAFTFEGGLDYVAWKIRRHSGVSFPVSEWQRRHPLLAAPGLAWRLYRRGAFR